MSCQSRKLKTIWVCLLSQKKKKMDILSKVQFKALFFFCLKEFSNVISKLKNLSAVSQECTVPHAPPHQLPSPHLTSFNSERKAWKQQTSVNTNASAGCRLKMGSAAKPSELYSRMTRTKPKTNEVQPAMGRTRYCLLPESGTCFFFFLYSCVLFCFLLSSCDFEAESYAVQTGLQLAM